MRLRSLPKGAGLEAVGGAGRDQVTARGRVARRRRLAHDLEEHRQREGRHVHDTQVRQGRRQGHTVVCVSDADLVEREREPRNGKCWMGDAGS